MRGEFARAAYMGGGSAWRGVRPDDVVAINGIPATTSSKGLLPVFRASSTTTSSCQQKLAIMSPRESARAVVRMNYDTTHVCTRSTVADSSSPRSSLRLGLFFSLVNPPHNVSTWKSTEIIVQRCDVSGTYDSVRWNRCYDYSVLHHNAGPHTREMSALHLFSCLRFLAVTQLHLSSNRITALSPSKHASSPSHWYPVITKSKS